MTATNSVALARSDRRWATAAMMLATAMQAADATMVNVALPQLISDFGVGIELGAWVVTSYLCAAAVSVPLTGWLSRKFGPRRLYRGAVALFVIASVLCALAPSALVLIALRILQGAAGGIIPALTQALLHDLHPRERQSRVLSVWGAVAMLGPILGPALSGAITDLASWRWVFLINVPLGVAATWRVSRVLPDAEALPPERFDFAGLLLLIVGIGTLQLWLQRSVGNAWTSPEFFVEAAIAAIAIGLTVARASRSRSPLLRLGVLRDVNFAAAALLNFATSGLLFAAIVFVPALLQGPLGHSATVAGLAIVPRAVLMMLIVLVVGRVVERVDYRLMLVVGSGLMALGAAVIAGPQIEEGLSWMIVGSTIQAIGAGMILMPLSTFAFVTLPAESRSDAAGLYSLLRQIGCASAVAIMTAVLDYKSAGHLAELSADASSTASSAFADQAMVQAYADCFRIMAIAALAMMPAILLFRPGRYLGQRSKAG